MLRHCNIRTLLKFVISGPTCVSIYECSHNIYLKEVFTPIQKWALSEGKHFPEHDTKAPHIGVGRVHVVLEALQGQPLDRDVGLGGHDVHVLVVGHGPGQPEVGDLDQFLTGYQNVPGC